MGEYLQSSDCTNFKYGAEGHGYTRSPNYTSPAATVDNYHVTSLYISANSAVSVSQSCWSLRNGYSTAVLVPFYSK